MKLFIVAADMGTQQQDLVENIHVCCLSHTFYCLSPLQRCMLDGTANPFLLLIYYYL